jgi:prophage antirepressor-like protein
MQNNIQVFNSPEFGNMEILMIDDKPHFPATECAILLGYSRPHNAVERHCRYSLKRGVPHPQSPDKLLEVNFIPEGDLYRLIIRSKLPTAIVFEKWVFDEVLPSIRKHGAYISEDVLRRMQENRAYSEELLNILTVERIRNAALYNKVAQLATKAIYHDIILQCPDTVQVSIIAKDYGMSAVAFNKLLYRLKLQFRMGNTWLLYQKYADKGYTVTKTFLINGKQVSMHTYFTQRGRFWLYELLKSHGILPEAEKRANRQMTFDDAGDSAVS